MWYEYIFPGYRNRGIGICYLRVHFWVFQLPWFSNGQFMLAFFFLFALLHVVIELCYSSPMSVRVAVAFYELHKPSENKNGAEKKKETYVYIVIVVIIIIIVYKNVHKSRLFPRPSSR